MINQSEHLVILVSVTTGWFVCWWSLEILLLPQGSSWSFLCIYLITFTKDVLFSPMSDCWLVGLFPTFSLTLQGSTFLGNNVWILPRNIRLMLVAGICLTEYRRGVLSLGGGTLLSAILVSYDFELFLSIFNPDFIFQHTSCSYCK